MGFIRKGENKSKDVGKATHALATLVSKMILRWKRFSGGQWLMHGEALSGEVIQSADKGGG